MNLDLGKRVWFGTLFSDDMLLPKEELIEAGLAYYTNKDEEYLNCDSENKPWFKICTRNHIAEYVNQIIN